MTEPRIELLEDLEAEFARVAAEHARSRRRRRGPAVAVLVALIALLGGAAYAVPPTRHAIDDLTGSFADWVAGNEDRAPGRALRPEDDAPEWVREEGGRLIAENHGVGLYVTRVQTKNGVMLQFALDQAIAVGDTLEGWRERFDEHSVVVLGPSAFGGEKGLLDDKGRIPLLGVTARSVDRLELRYISGPPQFATGVDGGFVLLVDAWRPLRELIAYDAAGHELERVDVRYLDMRYECEKEPGCP